MGASITLAGESLIAQKLGAQQRLEVVRFVFANVPGLNPNSPVNRAAPKPPAAQIVHTYTIPPKNIGFVNPNQVVYSSMLGSDIGDFDWNWIGLETAENVLLAVAYVPLQQKRKNIPPQQIGNNVTRNILVVFDGAQSLTGITIDASTWQHDFTVRLKGIDERERLSNRDMFGRACFFRNGWQVQKVGTWYQLNPGLAYIEGIRLELTSAYQIAPASAPAPVWLHVSLRGEMNDVVASWKVVFDPNQVDYVDAAGTRNYCIQLGHIAGSGLVTDQRKVAEIEGPLVDHFAAQVGHYPQLRSGNADKLSNPRKINGVAFDGSADVTVEDNSKLPLTGGTMAGGIRADFPAMGGGFVDWWKRTPALQIDCPVNQYAYSIWKGTNWDERDLAAMDVYSGGSKDSVPSVVLHVHPKINAFTFEGSGDLAILGRYKGSGALLQGLNASEMATGIVPKARLAGTYDVNVTGNAKTASSLESARRINNIPFDGSKDIQITDDGKLPLTGGTLSGSLYADFPAMAGYFVDWKDRSAALQISCPTNTAAYQVWRGTCWGDRHLAAMEVYAGGSSTSQPTVVMHVGGAVGAFTFDGSGSLTIKGSYIGDGGSLGGLNAGALALGTVPAARLSGTYSIAVTGNAGSASKLATSRLINGVEFDGTQNITIGDATKLPLAGGTLTGTARFDFPQLGGGFVDWRSRWPAVQVDCSINSYAYMVWRATKWNERHLASMEAYAGGGASTPAQVVTHVGSTNNAMTLTEGGNLSVAGAYFGSAAGLTNLPQATPDVPGAVLKNTASLGPSGWWKCAQTGLIKQWGFTLGASDTVTHRSFPIAFPNRCASLVASRTSVFYSDTSTGTNTLIVSNSQFSVISGPFNSPDEIYWEATGY
ncbi:phage tail protein [Pseudomonas sp. Wu6]|uniref:phage tail-collar fiber domain-containing protein n=1 Tax=Pseudomonas sp. Wu6 TaxID=1210129 RepID=UPI001CA6DBBA|nr:phage tail protein [Pseudomonas sp. Wu6]